MKLIRTDITLALSLKESCSIRSEDGHHFQIYAKKTKYQEKKLQNWEQKWTPLSDHAKNTKFQVLIKIYIHVQCTVRIYKTAFRATPNKTIMYNHNSQSTGNIPEETKATTKTSFSSSSSHQALGHLHTSRPQQLHPITQVLLAPNNHLLLEQARPERQAVVAGHHSPRCSLEAQERVLHLVVSLGS